MSKIEILKFLIKNNSNSYTINEISQNLSISYKVTYEIIQNFKKNNLITLNKIGHSSHIKFNFNYNELTYIAELQRKEELSKNKYIKSLSRKLSEIENPFFIALVFGSYSKGKQTKTSDIDLCLICDNNQLIKTIENELNLLPIDIHIQKFTTNEFKDMLTTINKNVGKEIINNNIILEGIENYYKIIKKYYYKEK